MGASMKDIKLRIKSVQSTMQITKAMKLVAASKLGRAKDRIDRAMPYFNIVHETLSEIAYSSKDFRSPFIQQREVKKICYVVIAGDRGLAGGYNSNVFKLLQENLDKAEAPVCVVPVGKKAVEYCQRRNLEILTEEYTIVENVSISDCFTAAHFLADSFREGKFDQLHVVYTNFASMLTQNATVMQVLPIPYVQSEAKDDPYSLLLYEPSPEVVFDAIVPEYISGVFYGALSDSWASELAARRTAMDAASKNAGEMIDDLSLKYNRARQGAITQEITEIVAGAER